MNKLCCECEIYTCELLIGKNISSKINEYCLNVGSI